MSEVVNVTDEDRDDEAAEYHMAYCTTCKRTHAFARPEWYSPLELRCSRCGRLKERGGEVDESVDPYTCEYCGSPKAHSRLRGLFCMICER